MTDQSVWPRKMYSVLKYIGSSIISPNIFARMTIHKRNSFIVNIVLSLIISALMALVISFPTITKLFIELGLGGLGFRFSWYIVLAWFIAAFLTWLISGFIVFIGAKIWQSSKGSISYAYAAVTASYIPQSIHGLLSPLYLSMSFGALTSILPITLGITGIWGIAVASIALSKLYDISIGSSATLIIGAQIVSSIISILAVLEVAFTII